MKAMMSSNRIRSIINSKESNKINLDGKEYDIVQFKSIVDTIKGEYSLKVENSKKIVRIIRIR
jgi:negative regulator of sigma E activity